MATVPAAQAAWMEILQKEEIAKATPTPATIAATRAKSSRGASNHAMTSMAVPDNFAGRDEIVSVSGIEYSQGSVRNTDAGVGPRRHGPPRLVTRQSMDSSPPAVLQKK